jgi:type II secretory ATPase GspE/PulE/Tfp pilus assembly ATPase PilB-like protein
MEQPKQEVRDAFGLAGTERAWHGSGCEQRAGTGFRGRVAICCLTENERGTSQLMRAGASGGQFEALAVEEGMVPINAQSPESARVRYLSVKRSARGWIEAARALGAISTCKAGRSDS